MVKGVGLILKIGVIVFCSIKAASAQQSDESGLEINMSPIWGSSPIQDQNGLIHSLQDYNWGVLPSNQKKSDMWGRSINRKHKFYKRKTDVLGRQIITDWNDNVALDNRGESLLIDSVNLNVIADTLSTDASPILPPPDPVDVPIDSWVAFLLIFGICAGYKKFKN